MIDTLLQESTDITSQQNRKRVVENCFHFDKNNDVIPVQKTGFFFNENFVDLARGMDGK